MSQVEPVRSMSHRKPVPKFIPSPPPSPPSSPGGPFRQISLSLISSPSPMQSDRPPLPNDWKDVIDRVVSRERRSTLPTINTVVDFSTHEGSSTDLDGEAEPLRQSPASTEFETRSYTFTPPSPSESFDGDPLSRPHSPTPWMRPGSKRKPQAEYRPPTPPLPRQKSLSAESISQGDSPVAITHTSRHSPPLPAPPLPTPPLPSPPLPAPPLPSPPLPPPPLPTPPRVSRPLPEIPVQDTTVLDTREVKQSVPVVRPEATRPPFFGPRKLPTPPSSLSTYECSSFISHARAPSHSEYSSTLASTCTPARTTPPSTVYSEKCPESTRTGYEVPIRMEPPKRETSLEHMRTKVEVSPPIISQTSKPRTLRQALAQGLQRIASLVVSAFLCR